MSKEIFIAIVLFAVSLSLLITNKWWDRWGGQVLRVFMSLCFLASLVFVVMHFIRH